MDCPGILRKFYSENTLLLKVLEAHSCQVADLALAVAKKQGLDEKSCRFVYEAAWLHDVGIGHTWLPKIGCLGSEPYIRHGVIGHEMLAELGLFKHALVCERHVGVGISCQDIVAGRLPLPMRDMTPQTIEERIVAYADKFFSKTSDSNGIAKTPEQAAAQLSRISPQSAATFLKWHQEFCVVPASNPP